MRVYEKLPGPFALSPQQEREVPIRLVDVDANGRFDGDDYFVFLGLGLADRFHSHWFDPDSSSRLMQLRRM